MLAHCFLFEYTAIFGNYFSVNVKHI